ncbi:MULTISPECIES: alpha/beta hydrolase [unclassified Aureimonas]|uniref:alpha/beta hydrolase n=1 Tax=unclassified Aureimonas TaxID=2615206 RepID=UPI0006F8E69F|nr:MULTISPECIES: alpha/beta hydrolase [unclassified Aureimonas]KQT61275.1 pectin acetylesterase [Aureimonas sp. Leaf460]KQT68724.1 pectin acetylesterase [Aureimonas sp. Leaf427]
MLDRRTFLQGAAAVLALTGSARAEMQTSSIRLWPNGMPGGGGPSGPPQGLRWGSLSHIAEPALDMIRPERPNGAAVLIAAGGGYTQISIAGEAMPAAEWLAGLGVTPFILTYRLPGEGWTDGPFAPLQDAQRALRTMRSQARPLGLDPTRMGFLGFSAGGHLLGLAAARAREASYQPMDAVDKASARPDFAALIYPVVTLKPPFDGTSSRRQLIGLHPTPEAASAWSVETHVRPGGAPTFLLHAEDDPIVDARNSQILAEACRKAGIPVELHRVATGGHGFALGRKGTASMNWTRLAEIWATGLGLFGENKDRISAL